MRTIRRQVAAILILLGALLASAVALAPPALAHATLLGSDPIDGSRLAVAPAEVTLQFSERVSLGIGFVRVVDARNLPVDAGTARTTGDDGDAVTVPLRAGLGDGGYLVSYQVLSADSHPVSGAVTFAVGTAPLLDASGSVTGGIGTDGRLAVAMAVARWLSYAGLVLLGGSAFVLLCWPAGGADRQVHRILAGGGALTAVAAISTLLLQGPYAAGRGPGSIGSPDLLRATLGVPIGKLLLLRLAVLALLAVLLSRALPAKARGDTRSGTEDAAALVAFVLLFTFAAVGHAVSDPLPIAAALADVAHLAAMSVWLGGLVLIAGRLLRAVPAAGAEAALPRFSRLALWCVGILVITGTYRALLAVGPPGALLGTPYGRLLLLKLAGVLGLVSLGASGRRVVGRLRSAPPPGREATAGSEATATPVADSTVAGLTAPVAPVATAALPAGPVAPEAGPVAPAPVPAGPVAVTGELTVLRRSVLVELAVAVAVLVVTAVLVAQPQGRAVYPAAVRAGLALGPAGNGQLTLSPARAGSNTVRLELTDATGRPVTPAEVQLTAALPADRLGPLRLRLDRVGPGSYSSEAITLPRAGRWTLTVRVRTGAFDTTAARITVRVRG